MHADGRWHSRGRPVVYLAESPASALLEVLVRLELDALTSPPARYQLLEIEAPDSLPVAQTPSLPDKWRDDVERTRAIGDEWLIGQQAPLLRVPSAIAPFVWNFLLNPMHSEAALVAALATHRVPFDARLFGADPRSSIP